MAGRPRGQRTTRDWAKLDICLFAARSHVNGSQLERSRSGILEAFPSCRGFSRSHHSCPPGTAQDLRCPTDTASAAERTLPGIPAADAQIGRCYSVRRAIYERSLDAGLVVMALLHGSIHSCRKRPAANDLDCVAETMTQM